MHYSHQHDNELLGGAIGATLAAVNNLLKNADSINGVEIFHTVVLAAVGAVVGFLVTTLLKWIKKKLS